LSAKTLKEYEELLPSEILVRVHRGHMVNKSFISRYNREGMVLILTDGSSVEVSRRKKAQFMRFMGE